MKTEFMLLTALIFVFHIPLTAQEWQEYTIEGSGMYVQLPGKPDSKTQYLEANGTKIALHTLSYTDETMNYTAGYSDYPPGMLAETSVDSLLNATRDSVMSRIDSRLVTEKDIRYDEYPGREVKLSIMNDKAMIKIHYYLVNNRLFQVLVVVDPLQLYSDEVERFFDSFRLTEDAGLSPAEQLLKTIGWTYDKQEDGDIHLTLGFEDERTQLVRIAPVTSSFTGIQTYDIWSVISNDDITVPDSIYRKMLIKNGDTDIGRFQIFPGDSTDLIVYSAVFEGEMSPDILRDIINEVAAVADIYEEQITRKDDY